MRRLGLTAALVLALAPAAALAKPAPAAPPVAELVRAVEVPFETFTLDNGLRVVVHTDRKAPVVAVAVWFNVGSKDEPAGKTGFAHLFEHIMLFNGTENIPNLIVPLRDMGATDWNGTTWFDRTNYFETVPVTALEAALYIESERMGHVLGALSQERLDAQRGIVQNEKRQGDNQPFGLVWYRILEALFPEGHPYRHSTIGSMADLDSASLDDVRDWFREKYGPNNAVLVLAGDIDAAGAEPLVRKYFDHIARGPANIPAAADVPTLKAPVSDVMRDRVANTRLYRSWTVPGLTDADTASLDLAALVLGGMNSSRLDAELVRKDKTAVGVSAYLQSHQRVGIFQIVVDVKPGVDPSVVEARLDALLADFLAKGPSPDELKRAVMQRVAQRTRAVEQVGGFDGKTVLLAEGALYADDPGFFGRRLREYADVTPDRVRTTAGRWLSRPVHALKVEPGVREPYQEASAVRPPAASAPPPPKAPRAPMPLPGPAASLTFPTVERAALSNGVPVVYARRQGAPLTLVTVEFDAGLAADRPERLGEQRLMLDLLDEGAGSFDSAALAAARDRLGATLAPGWSMDRSWVTLSALSPNLPGSLDLLADVVLRPTFAPHEVERVRAQQLASIASERTSPNGLAQRALPPLIYGAAHPYGRPFSGLGEEAVVAALTRADLLTAHAAWIRPDKATIFVVSDRPLSEIAPALEARFGRWTAPKTPPGLKDFATPIPPASPRIVLIDRPQSPQSLIYAGSVLPVSGSDDLVTLNAANEVLGNGFLSRINTDIREVKGWSYGLRGWVNAFEHRTPYLMSAPVQADRTGDSIKALLEHYRAFAADRGVTADEHRRTVNGSMNQLQGQFETAAAVLGALRGNALFRRPDDYWTRIADRYRGMTAGDMDAALRAVVDAGAMTWVVVGDADKVAPQLQGLGLEVEIRRAP